MLILSTPTNRAVLLVFAVRFTLIRLAFMLDHVHPQVSTRVPWVVTVTAVPTSARSFGVHHWLPFQTFTLYPLLPVAVLALLAVVIVIPLMVTLLLNPKPHPL
jgi:hypothetical protein